MFKYARLSTYLARILKTKDKHPTPVYWILSCYHRLPVSILELVTIGVIVPDGSALTVVLGVQDMYAYCK